MWEDVCSRSGVSSFFLLLGGLGSARLLQLVVLWCVRGCGGAPAFWSWTGQWVVVTSVVDLVFLFLSVAGWSGGLWIGIIVVGFQWRVCGCL